MHEDCIHEDRPCYVCGHPAHYVIDEDGTYRGVSPIITAVNLFPLYEAVREAAQSWAALCHDYDLNIIGQSEMARLRAALDALQAAEDAL
jgi:hypothetical protein